MTALLPELSDLPAELIFDGEIVTFSDGRPHQQRGRRQNESPAHS
jgi:hypothetical protein